MFVGNWISFTVLFILRNSTTTGAFLLPSRNNVNVAISATTTTTKRTKTALRVSGFDAVVSDSVRNLAVAGRIPWKKLLITKDQGRQILSIMRAETHVCDLVAVFVLSLFLKSIGKFM